MSGNLETKERKINITYLWIGIVFTFLLAVTAIVGWAYEAGQKSTVDEIQTSDIQTNAQEIKDNKRDINAVGTISAINGAKLDVLLIQAGVDPRTIVLSSSTDSN